jgi:hypothetical protein
MTPAQILIALLAVGVVAAGVRLIRWQARAPADARAPLWRLALLLAAQPVCAVLLYFTLMPPPVDTPAGTLVVLTRGARSVGAEGSQLVALPESRAGAAVERVPDLGTALRRYPSAARVRVVGEGLGPRDRAALGSQSVVFEPSPERRGIVHLAPPGRVVPGAPFGVGGRVADLEGGTVELLDPAGRVADRATIGADGAFALRAAGRATGTALFAVRARDRGRTLVEQAAVPVVISDDIAPRVLLLAGAPGPEPKFLRRWAADAGLPMHAQLSVGGGIELGDAPLPLTAATFGRFDVAIVDERSWAAMGPGARAALAGAVRSGLGLLLRVTGPVPDATRRQWQALGIDVRGGAAAVPVALAGAGGLTRRDARIGVAGGVPLLRDAQGAVLTSWVALGRGRVAAWPVTDSYVLALRGTPAAYAQLWSETFAALGRPRPQAAPRLDSIVRVGERLAACGIADGATIAAPVGDPARLIVERPSRCAAFWPRRSGWHLLTAGAVGWPFYVHPADALPALRAAEARDATLRLAADRGAAGGAAATVPRPGSSWPWAAAWLLASGALWWFERRRRPNPPA